ncbi:MAG: hypothetical protein SVE93_05705 [Candidatus Thermoplasmatota archaeon]|nr:hypothetical protein [Candidatus Thermoplasmatota archaeon]
MDSTGIADRIAKELEDEDADVSDENFFAIKQKPGRASFIDGSSYELLSTPSKDFYLIRIAVERFDGGKRLQETLEDFLCIANGNETKIIGHDGEEEINSSSMDMSRSLLEWRSAEEENGTVLIDGSLESPFFDTPKTESMCGVMKSSRVNTRRMAKRAKELEFSTWAYEINKDDFVCRLHSFTNLVFEVQTEDRDNLAYAAYYSSDPLIPGYPFGLVEAHRRAKIDSREVKELRALLYAKGINYVELHDFLEG